MANPVVHRIASDGSPTLIADADVELITPADTPITFHYVYAQGQCAGMHWHNDDGSDTYKANAGWTIAAA